MTTIGLVASSILDSDLTPMCETLVLEGDKITNVCGSIPSYSKKIELDGYIFPSFIDAHMHLTWLALSQNGIDLSKARSPEEVGVLMSKSREFFVYGRGWDQELFPDPNILPSRDVLDKYIPDRPAIAVRVCGHLAVGNTPFLSITKPWVRYPDLVNKEQGLLREEAVDYSISAILNHIPLSKYIEKTLNTLANSGIGGIASLSCHKREHEVLIELSSRKRFLQKVSCYPEHQYIRSFDLNLSNTYVAITGVKLFSDGSFGARTAYLFEDYSDDPGNKGMLLLSSSDIKRIAEPLLDKNLMIATHAIGDAAISEVLEAYEVLDVGDRGRIEHFSLSTDSMIRKAADLGVHVVVQPYFRISDWWLDKRLGNKRIRDAYKFRTMISRGVKIAFSTDAPVDPYDPVETLRASYSLCDTVLCRKEEALSPREAFQAYTINAAKAAGGPVESMGVIEKGVFIGNVAWTPDDPSNPYWSGKARLLPLVLNDIL